MGLRHPNTRERSVVHLRAAGTLARVSTGSMCRNGEIRHVTVVIRHHLMQFIASSKNLVAMIAAGIAVIFAKSLNTIPRRRVIGCTATSVVIPMVTDTAHAYTAQQPIAVAMER
ncbi:hypothetical protein AWB69_03948 [Caballeronia udeis]|uniref:Uncharacterized protein n=1 Tax=Caballeronia udeis TaxID=1232866 RepID=A0A158H5J1_9BURK|nr:hypothetical protein [Caballeronia udeis]SAL39556.1 hypothetical protein AWB69_03948 [Caballeronia udeis]